MNELLQIIESERKSRKITKENFVSGFCSVSTYNRYLDKKDMPVSILLGLLNKLGLDLSIIKTVWSSN